ncbi:flagellar hook protein FlgE [Hydrogenimonas sp.]
MNRSFYNGVSGTKTYQYGMDVLANDIANINTVGYKGTRTEFSTIFSQTLSESAALPTTNQVGLGSRVGATALDLSQGSLISSDRNFDLAIAGEGWFRIAHDGATYYTRTGAMGPDASEFLTDENGGRVLGFSANNLQPFTGPDGQTRYRATLVEEVPIGAPDAAAPIFLPSDVFLPASPTTEVSLKGNLDPTPIVDEVQLPLPAESYTLTVTGERATLEGQIPSDAFQNPRPGERVFVDLYNTQGRKLSLSATLDADLRWRIDGADVATLDPLNAGPIRAEALLETRVETPNEAKFVTPVILPDGEEGRLVSRFVKRVPQGPEGSVWDATVQITGKEPDETGAYPVYDEKSGALTFNAKGALAANTLPPLDNRGTPLTLFLGTPYDPARPNSGYDGLTTLGTLDTYLSDETHDGYRAGVLKDYLVADDGTVYANFTNGKTTAVANIPVYHFANDQGLEKAGGNYFKATSNSGRAIFYTDAAGNVLNLSQIRPNSLEASNVRMDVALTELILLQKAFDANAKSITTSDQMIQKAINMKK